MTRFDEFDKIEWRDACRKVRPDWTAEQFEQKWTEFQREKQKRARQ